MKKYVLQKRYSLFASITLLVFLVVLVEGRLSGRISERFGFTSPLLDIRVNDR